MRTLSCLLLLFAFSAFSKGAPGESLVKIEAVRNQTQPEPEADVDQIRETIDPIQMKMIHDFVKKTNNCQLELGNSCNRTPSNRSVQ